MGSRNYGNKENHKYRKRKSYSVATVRVGLGVQGRAMKTLKVSFAIGQPVKRDGFACRDEGQLDNPLGSRMMMINAFPLATLGDDVREVQSAGGAELRPFVGRTLMPSILDKAFKGEL